MYKNIQIFCMLLFVFCHFSTLQAGSRYYGYRAPTKPPVTEPPPPQTPKEFLDSNSNFSTFGIIAIIFAVILFCLIIYYGIMCYPLLCKDEKKYRFMDVSSTMTAATSRSIQSIENYPVDQKTRNGLE